MGDNRMSVLITQFIYTPKTYTGVFLPGHLRFGPPHN